MLDKTIFFLSYLYYLHAEVNRGKLKSHLKCRNWKGDIDGPWLHNGSCLVIQSRERRGKENLIVITGRAEKIDYWSLTITDQLLVAISW